MESTSSDKSSVSYSKMDTLNKVLNALSFETNFYFAVQLYGSWGITIPKYSNVARFHIACAGCCLFDIEGVDEYIELLPGDMLIIPHGVSHTLLDSPETQRLHIDDVYARSNYNGSKKLEVNMPEGSGFAELLCGHFEFDNTLEHPFVKQLPTYILLQRPQSDEFKWLRDALLHHTHSDRLDKPGNGSIIKRLSEIIFTLAIQSWQEERQETDGFIAAISDPYISKTLNAFHSNADQRWTVEELAKHACMSRTQFTERFTKLVKMPPMQYITLWRMTNAQKLLSNSAISIQHIANQSGYESVAAFSKAFKRFVGVTPGEYRKQAIERSQVEVAT